MKHKLYPAVVLGVVGLGLALWLINRFEISVQVEPGLPTLQPTPGDAIAPSTDLPDSSPSGLAGVAPERDATATASPTPSPKPSPSSTSTLPASQSPAQSTPQQGGLRISNQTDYPIRVVLLSQVRVQPAAPSKATGQLTRYGEPVHWDFAPQEGNAQGLLLALPDRDLLLQTGDILVAFAQDGSRRYWGPYVVGNSAIPQWNQSGKEWQLRIQTP